MNFQIGTYNYTFIKTQFLGIYVKVTGAHNVFS